MEFDVQWGNADLTFNNKKLIQTHEIISLKTLCMTYCIGKIFYQK